MFEDTRSHLDIWPATLMCGKAELAAFYVQVGWAAWAEEKRCTFYAFFLDV